MRVGASGVVRAGALGSSTSEALVRSSRGFRWHACVRGCGAGRDSGGPEVQLRRCARPRRDTRSSVCDDGNTPTFGRTPNVGGVRGVRVPAKYDGFEGLPAKAADATRVPGADADGFVTLDVDISRPTTPAPPGGYPLIAFMHGCCAGDKNAWQRPDFGTRRDLALQQRLVRVARLRGGQLHVARVPATRPVPAAPPARPQLDSRLLRDQRLPAPRGPGRGRPVLQREPAEGGAHGRLLRRRLRLDGAHRPEVDEPRRART